MRHRLLHLSASPFTRSYYSKEISSVISEKQPSTVAQAANRASTWSPRQQPREDAISGPRFTQVDLEAQPKPLAAIEMIKNDPIRYVETRQVNCSGDGPLGHPSIFINLDKGEIASCSYCGRKFKQLDKHH